MDIDRLNQIGSTGINPREGIKSNRKKSGKIRSFSKILAGVKKEETAGVGLTALPVLDGSESLEELLDAVHGHGEALKRDPVLGPLNQYKQSVRRFLRYILDNGLAVEEKAGIRNPQTWKQKKYLQIRVVDQKLENLAAHILKGQANQFEILRKVDEINGLLFDMSG